MEDCTKVLVYGSFDGFAHSTDSSLLISVVLDGGEKVEIPEEFIVSADQMVNKYKIKLKDVIARIKSLDVGIQEVWLDKILKELGSDYGSLKYRAGYEQGTMIITHVWLSNYRRWQMRMESEGDMTPKELCQFIMDTIMKNAELITIKTGEDDGIEKRIFPGSGQSDS